MVWTHFAFDLLKGFVSFVVLPFIAYKALFLILDIVMEETIVNFDLNEAFKGLSPKPKPEPKPNPNPRPKRPIKFHSSVRFEKKDVLHDCFVNLMKRVVSIPRRGGDHQRAEMIIKHVSGKYGVRGLKRLSVETANFIKRIMDKGYSFSAPSGHPKNVLLPNKDNYKLNNISKSVEFLGRVINVISDFIEKRKLEQESHK